MADAEALRLDQRSSDQEIRAKCHWDRAIPVFQTSGLDRVALALMPIGKGPAKQKCGPGQNLGPQLWDLSTRGR
jgi:hypothetical protein